MLEEAQFPVLINLTILRIELRNDRGRLPMERHRSNGYSEMKTIGITKSNKHGTSNVVITIIQMWSI